MSIKETLYHFIKEDSIWRMRVYLTFSSFINALIFLLSNGQNHETFFWDADQTALIYITSFFFFSSSLLTTFNLCTGSTNRVLLLIDVILCFLLYSAVTAYIIVTFSFPISIAPQIIANFISWCVLVLTSIRR